MPNFEQVREFFEKHGIETSTPGFYDDSRFRQLESDDPGLLDRYAIFVREQDYDDAYLQRAEAIVLKASRFLYERLVREDQRGRCIDASLVLSRFLEVQGIWNYAETGGFSIYFPSASQLGSVYHAPIMMGENVARTGHLWLNAPPFKIVDITASLQPYRRGEDAYLPDIVLAKEPVHGEFTIFDLVDQDVRVDFSGRFGREPSLQDLNVFAPEALPGLKRHGVREVFHGGTKLRYLAIAITAPEEPLEDWGNLRLDGKLPIQLYEDFVDEC